MRINATSRLTRNDVVEAIRKAQSEHGQDIMLTEWQEGKHGGKSFYCHSEHGRYSTGRNDGSGNRAASWTAHGWVIAELFTRDPDAHIGSYHGRDHFIRCIYGEQRSYILRQSLGMRDTSAKGSDCSFLSLFPDDALAAQH